MRLAKQWARHSIRLAALTICLAGVPAWGAPVQPSQLLIVFSYNDEMPWQAKLQQGLDAALATSAADITVYRERLDGARFARPQDTERFAQYLQLKYAQRELDLVLVMDGPAAQVFVKHDELFEGVPRVMVNPEDVMFDAARLSNTVTLPLRDDLIAGFEEVVRMRPGVLVHVIGDVQSPFLREPMQSLMQAIGQRQGIQVEYLLGLSKAELFAQISRIPPEQAIYFTLVFRDSEGEEFIPRELVEAIADRSSAPVFVHYDTFLGTGAVGGLVTSGEKVGRLSGEYAVSRLLGTAPAVPDVNALAYIYDESALARHGISPATLPDHARLINPRMTLWAQYQREVLWILGMVLVLVMVAGLVLWAWRRAAASQKALLQSQQQLEAAETIANLGSWSLVLGSGKLACSEETLRILGLDPQGEVDQLDVDIVLDRVHPEDRDELRDRFARMANEAREIDFVYRLLLPGGDIRQVHQVGRVLNPDAVPRQVQGFLQDVTEQQQTQQRLMQAERQHAVWHLAGSMGHHFNNLFARVLGNAELLEIKLSDSSQKDHAQQIIEHVHAAADLNQKLMSFCRQEMLNVGRITTERLLRDYEPRLRSLSGDNVELELRLDDGLWPLNADRGATERALDGLMVNAVEAQLSRRAGSGLEPGRILIHARNVALDETDAARFAALKPGDYVLISVQDNGPGMPDEVVERAFDPFFSTKTRRDAAGMGLSSIYGYMRQIEGGISLTSAIDEGSTVSLYFPRGTAESESDQKPERPSFSAAR